ncbi:MAG: UvrD-helicase domain-containing protein, partial [Bilifractor sp.]|nr:UvrD-helicase domain-containing protein [Bilifractor sp.]
MNDILSSLNAPQREAVTTTEGPLLILAGAGSGKTRTLTCRVAYLISQRQVSPWNIMAITFTNKAAGEMRERVDQLVTAGSESIWISTFHSTCCRILRRYINLIGYENNFTIYDTDDSRQVMKEVIRLLELDPKVYKEKAILRQISSAKNEMIGPEEYEKNASGWVEKQYARCYYAYQKRLKENNALDFDDLLVLTVELFRREPDVLSYYQEKFRYIMIDEYQDTNTVQFLFVKLLASRYRNLCVVGDDDQSIYKFRGANIRNILNFEKEYPGAKVIRLEQNYRSTQNILNAANEVIAHNVGRKKKKLWTENTEGSKIHFREFDDGYQEAEYIARDISSKCSRDGMAYHDFAVLYRTNAMSRIF